MPDKTNRLAPVRVALAAALLVGAFLVPISPAQAQWFGVRVGPFGYGVADPYYPYAYPYYPYYSYPYVYPPHEFYPR